jgi:hypothetical protein
MVLQQRDIIYSTKKDAVRCTLVAGKPVLRWIVFTLDWGCGNVYTKKEDANFIV